MSVRTAAPAAATAASTPNFLSLARLDELPELVPYVELCDELGAEICDLDQRIRHATQRLTAMWRAFQDTAILGTNQEEDPAVTQARAEVAALEAQRKDRAARAVTARADLQAATVQLRNELMPQMAAQLCPALRGMLHALAAAQAVERLLGPLGAQHAQARALVNVLVAYFRELRDVLGKEN